MNMNDVNKQLENVKSKFTPQLRKRIITGIVLASLIGGIGTASAEYVHQMQKDKVKAAQAEMIRVDAEKNGVTLLTEDQVRTLAADAVGVDETALTYKSVNLVTFDKEKNKDEKHEGHDKKYKDHDKSDKHNDKKDKSDKHKDRDDREQHNNQMQPQNANQPNVAPTTNTQPIPIANGQPTPVQNGQPAVANGQPTAAPTPVNMNPNAMNNQPPMQKKVTNPIYRVKATKDGVDYKVLIDAVTGQIISKKIGD